MKTIFLKEQEAVRNWYVIDAADKPLGRVAAKAASVLRGKDKVSYTPNQEMGDFVVIINADKVAVTGTKAKNKMYYHHTGYIGHMKSVRYDELMEKKPELALELAVKGMIPDNTIGRKALTRLHIYQGSEHKHAAQQPIVLE